MYGQEHYPLPWQFVECEFQCNLVTTQIDWSADRMSSSILPQSEDRSRRVEARNKMIVALRKSAESLDEILKGRNRWKKAEEISALIGRSHLPTLARE